MAGSAPPAARVARERRRGAAPRDDHRGPGRRRGGGGLGRRRRGGSARARARGRGVLRLQQDRPARITAQGGVVGAHARRPVVVEPAGVVGGADRRPLGADLGDGGAALGEIHRGERAGGAGDGVGLGRERPAGPEAERVADHLRGPVRLEDRLVGRDRDERARVDPGGGALAHEGRALARQRAPGALQHGVDARGVAGGDADHALDDAGRGRRGSGPHGDGGADEGRDQEGAHRAQSRAAPRRKR